MPEQPDVRTATSGTAAGDPAAAGQEAVAAGYQIVLPPGWQRIPARRGTDAKIRQILDRAAGSLPPGVPSEKLTAYRKEAEQRLRTTVAQARRKGALDVYLPVSPRKGILVPASFVVSEGSLGAADPADPAATIAYLASTGEGYNPVTVDGAAGARIEHTAGPEASLDAGEYGSRRVDYILPVPGERDRWLVIAFSTFGGGDPDDDYARLLVELFDAMMATFRWTRREPATTEPQGAR
ncbi:MAG: hypothetical protein J2P35_18685 [Actinobacteria bacterium]|nr:hypothetical protein [Actinomycetota bacterium]